VIDNQYFTLSSTDKSAATGIPKPISVEYITVSIESESMVDTEGYEWQITDIAGSSVKIGKFRNAIETINTNQLNSGIYLIRVVKDNTLVKVEKFSIIK
jgi:hypothetical protein